MGQEKPAVRMAANSKAQNFDSVNRRSVLRGGLLVGAGIATAGVASAALTGTAKAATAAIANPQPSWIWCNACAGMWTTNSMGNRCRGTLSQTHNVGPSSYKYFMYNNMGNTGGYPQGNWNMCYMCAGLFTTLHTPSVCFGNDYGPHKSDNGVDYYLYYSEAGANWQPNWRWCGKCQLLYYQGAQGTQAGACPDSGYHEEGGGSDNYAIYWSGQWPALH